MLNSTATNQLPGPPHFVDLHVNPGESVSIQFFDGNEAILRGPTSIKMISQHAYPPMPMPVQVPPGHMIQQIVDENGTLRHIILSALNGGNGTSYTSSPNYGPHQQHQSAPNSPYCCCCYNTCSSGSTTPQNSINSSVSSPQVQPHLNHNPISFPLSHSFARPRRSNRNFSSPNGKRLSNYSSSASYYTATPTSKVTPTRYKSDNPKSNHFNSRYSTPIHYDSTRPYDSSETKYYLNNKNYDYSCNSSNASQASTLDQINDNLKYYKEDNFCIEDDFGKKSFDANSANSTKESSYYLDFSHQPNLTQDTTQLSQWSTSNDNKSATKKSPVNQWSRVRNLSVPLDNCSANKSDQESHKSSQSECADINQEAVSCDIFDATASDVGSQSADQADNADSELSGDFVVAATVDLTTDKQRLTSSGKDAEAAAALPIDYEPPCTIEKALPHSDDTGQCNLESKSCDEELRHNKLERTKSLANGGLETRHPQVGGFVIHADPNDSEKSDSDQYPDEDVEQAVELEIVGPAVTPQRSPRHLLPKQEVINLACTSLSSNSVRLKWFFTQPSEHSEHKKHFLVDLLQDSADDDSPNSRIVYQGHTANCRVSHLQAQKEYTFRVRTNTDTAVLTSNLLSVVTSEQQTPTSAKACGRRGKQSMQQQLLQQQQQIFHQQQLLMQQQQQLVEVRQVNLTSAHTGTLLPSSLSSDQRYAILILTGFTFLALLVAVLIQHLLSPD